MDEMRFISIPLDTSGERGRESRQFLQDTIDYIGAGKFDRLGDAEAAIEEMRTEREGAADDD